MRRVLSGACSCLIAVHLSASSSVAFGAGFRYVSCIGNEWSVLKLQAQRDGVVCFGNGNFEVCRNSVAGVGDATSKVTVSQAGRPVVDWLENGDPSYLSRTLAFVSVHGELVVATLQSESQGMALRDWNVAYVYSSSINAPKVQHAATAEFGAEGSLVKAANAQSAPCSLLVSEWKSRQTKEGERLFLAARLRSLSAVGFASATGVLASVRFDNRIKKLREQDDPRIPLRLFEARP